jgi:hypothetical protein
MATIIADRGKALIDEVAGFLRSDRTFSSYGLG